MLWDGIVSDNFKLEIELLENTEHSLSVGQKQPLESLLTTLERTVTDLYYKALYIQKPLVT